MSVVETIRGLRKMGLADSDGGAAATPPPSPRNPHPISVAAVVAGFGHLDGLRAILTEYWRSDIIPKYPPEWLEARNVPKEMIELLTNGIEEALCRGFLDLVRAVDMAVRRAELLIGENITLPLTRDKERVLQLIREKEEDDWKGIVRAMNNAFYYE